MDQFTAEQANRMICSLVNYRPEAFTAIRTGDSIEEDWEAIGLPIWLLAPSHQTTPEEGQS